MIPTIFFSAVFGIAGYQAWQSKKAAAAKSAAEAVADLKDQLREELQEELQLHLKEELNKAKPRPAQKRRRAKPKPVEAKEPDWALLDKPAYMRRSGKK